MVWNCVGGVGEPTVVYGSLNRCCEDAPVVYVSKTGNCDFDENNGSFMLTIRFWGAVVVVNVVVNVVGIVGVREREG